MATGELLAITFPAAKQSERKAMNEYLDVVSVTKPVAKTRERKLDKVEMEEIEEMFRVFDLDGNGTVSINELIETLKMMGSYGADFLSIEDLQKIAAKCVCACVRACLRKGRESSGALLLSSSSLLSFVGVRCACTSTR